MMRLAVVNQKGGVGKTTLALNLGHLAPRPALLIDLDPQANLTAACGFNRYALPADSSDVLLSEQLRQPWEVPEAEGLFLLPASPRLDTREADLERTFLAEQALARTLDGAAYRTVIMDTSPYLASIYTRNALFAASEVLLPIDLEPFSVESLAYTLAILDRVQRARRGLPRLLGIVPNGYDRRRGYREEHEAILAEIAAELPDLPILPSVRYALEVPRSHRRRTPAYHNPGLLEDFQRLAKAIFEEEHYA